MAETFSRMLSDALNWLAAVAGVSGELVVNLFVLLLAVAMIAWRVREEWRSGQWARLSPDERRERIWLILNEAWETAEWLFSHLDPIALEDQQAVGELKRKAAIEYTKRELRAHGAGRLDLATVDHRIETVCAQRNAGKQRYGGR